MKISALIRRLQEVKNAHGDVILWTECNDGRSTYAMPVSLDIKQRKIWKNHPQGVKIFLKV